ncbi:MAG: hypothetical protein ACREPF_09325 [Rhodanobacteraceae bacterium]
MQTYSLDVVDALLQQLGPRVAVIRKCFEHRAAEPLPDRFERRAMTWFVVLTLIMTLAGVVLAPLLH